MSFAHVHCLRLKGSNAQLLNAPQVAQECNAKLRTGNLCPVSALVPVNASLVPHFQNHAWWQVLPHAGCIHCQVAAHQARREFLAYLQG